jgi:hypothetical protein
LIHGAPSANLRHLRVLRDERDPICPLTAVETSPRKRATGRRLDQCLVTVMAVSDEAPTPMTVPTVVVTTCGPPPSSSLTREALTRRGDDTSPGGYGG